MTPLWSVGTAAFASSTTGSAARHGGKATLIGGVIGFGIGAALGVTLGAESCLNEARWHCAVKAGASIGAIGAVVGWLHR